MEISNRADRVWGSLIGGAVGDSLGYPVEFDTLEDIYAKFGSKGIRSHVIINGVAQISDDTQMTIFTADAILQGLKNNSGDIVESCVECLRRGYQQWAAMQVEDYPLTSIDNPSLLSHVKELYENREPGRACITALLSGEKGSIKTPVNMSKGCGGVMRVAPIGLCFSAGTAPQLIGRIAAEAAAITHGHELGYITAAALACAVHELVNKEDTCVCDAIRHALSVCKELFPNGQHIEELTALISKALELAQDDISDVEAIMQLGEGWVAEEALAIAVFCAIRYENDMEGAVVAAVNHGGDSDSTGAITGNIVGARVGYNHMPLHLIEKLELIELLKVYAQKLSEQRYRGV